MCHLGDMPDWTWPVLTTANCFFIVLHSHPLDRFVRGVTTTESRKRKVHRKLLILVSAAKDNKALPWETDTSINPNTIY